MSDGTDYVSYLEELADELEAAQQANELSISELTGAGLTRALDLVKRLSELDMDDGASLTEALLVWRDRVHETACDSGFWPGDLGERERVFLVATKIALIANEAVGEALEAWRIGNPPDDHLPQHPSVAAELADIVIRCLDLAGYLGIDLGQALVDKDRYNKSRPRKHGGKLF